ncbi:solute carrier organic anion transporter family member 74D-like [Hyalella azteca]|uniref:Solute carrier organic anion transporter family member 74D-like n=1 Tax=Hyalella azteca TaxID=294128 RepID=A0A979FRX8_HYAAZ|nr:solute carrier organic anion transporter family member 74D-like [Hyalella azteca]
MDGSVLTASNAMLDALPPSPAEGAEDDQEAEGRSKMEIKQFLLDMDLDDIKCGLGPCKPNFLQMLARKEIYMLIYNIVGVLMGMFFTYTVSVISTVEKRFDMSSKQTGIVLAGNDVSQVLLSIVITYYGSYGDRPRWMGLGVINSALSCFIAASPHLIYGSGGEALATALLSSVQNSSSTEGIALVGRMLGPVMGFFLGSKCLSYWIDLSLDPEISRRDPRWLGAWWLGFLILGTLLAISGFSLMFFPKQLSSSLAAQIQRLERAEIMENPPNSEVLSVDHYLNLTRQKKKHTKPSLKKLPSGMKRLFSNKVYIGTCFATACVVLAFSGHSSFEPKYIETQFHISASEANFYTGVTSLIASVFGSILGGVVTKWKQPRARYVAAYSFFVTIVSASIMFTLAFVKCPGVNILGIEGVCSLSRECSTKFQPVCSQGLQTYYSACYAGCTSLSKNGSELVHGDCACIADPLISIQTLDSSAASSSLVYNNAPVNGSPSSGGWAADGYCPNECSSFFTYIGLTIVSKLITATGSVGGTMVFLRSVYEGDKALALGVITVLYRLFGFIPGPIIMGAVVDSACMMWDRKCGQRGNCWLYDSDKFRLLMHLVAGSLMLLSIIGDIVVFIYSKEVELYKEPEDKVEIYEAKGKEAPNLSIVENNKKLNL